MNKKIQKRAMIIFLGCLFLLCLTFLHSRLPMGGDAIAYISAADSLAHFEGYSVDSVPQTKWPPVLSLILSPLLFLFGTNIVIMKLVIIFISIGALYLSYMLLSSLKDRDIAFWAVVISGLSFPFIYHSVGIYSDMPYMLFSMAALIFIDKYSRSGNNNLSLAISAGIFTALSVLTRSVGFSLLITGVVYLAFASGGESTFKMKGKKILMFLIIALIPVGLWYLRNILIKGGHFADEYMVSFIAKEQYAAVKESAGFLVFIEKIYGNIIGYLRIFAIPDKSIQFSSGGNKFLVAFSFIISFSWGFGYIWNAIKRRSVIEYYIAVTFVPLLLLSWYDIRYLVPILPFIMYYFLFTIKKIINALILNIPLKVKNSDLIVRRVFVTVVGAIVFVNLIFSTVSGKAFRLRNKEYTGSAREHYDAAQWIKDYDKEAVVMCTGASMVGFWTGLKSVPFPFTTNDKEIIAVVDDNSVNFVIVDNFKFVGKTERFLKPAMEKNKDRFQKIMDFGETTVYQVVD